jgi:hypothetical protein
MLTTTKLMGGGTLIEGTDITGQQGRTVLVSSRWEAVQSIRAHIAAGEAFDEAVKAFFAPITDAAEAAAKIAHPSASQYDTFVVSEGVEGEEREVIQLDAAGIILRLLDEDRQDLLRWVGDDLVAIAD